MNKNTSGLSFTAAAFLAAFGGCAPQVAAQDLAPIDKACIAAIENRLLPPVTIKGRSLPEMTLAGRMAFYKVPGISIAVIHNGKIAWARGFGVTKIGGSAVTPDTLFQAASISKSVLALAVLHLVQTGRLSLDRDVNQYLTSWKAPENRFTEREKVTLRELLTHTAGVTDTPPDDGVAAGDPIPTLVQVLNGVKPAINLPLGVDFTPGTTWRYSNGGYDVLAQLLQDVSGEPVPKLMQDTVIGPIGMAHSTYEQPLPSDKMAAAAMPYDSNGEPIKGGPYTYPAGEAGLWTTPSDLARCAIEVQASLSGKSQRVLTKAMTREMLQPAVQPSWLLFPEDTSWGLGLELHGGPKHPYFEHHGTTAGYTSNLIAYDAGDGAVIMTNSDNGDPLIFEALDTIAHEYGWPDFQPTQRRIAAIDPKLLDRYVGHYQTGPYNVRHITREGDSLFDGATELFPQSEREWVTLDGDQYTFGIDVKGRVTQLSLPLRFIHTPARRIDAAEAKRVEAKRAAKFERQSQDPGTEVALRLLIDQLQRGRPNYKRMIPGLADFVRQHLWNIHSTLAPFGPLRSLAFKGVPGSGDDVYQADFENGALIFRIALMPDGKILRVTERPSLAAAGILNQR